MRLKVKEEMATIYRAEGGMMALAALKVGQIWMVVGWPEEHRPWYTIKRDSIVIDMLPEDVERYFVEVRMGEMCEECPIHFDSRRLNKLKLIQDIVEQYRATYERMGVKGAVSAWLKSGQNH